MFTTQQTCSEVVLTTIKGIHVDTDSSMLFFTTHFEHDGVKKYPQTWQLNEK